MNRSVSPLQQASLGLVLDALLDEWPDGTAAVEASAVDAGEIDYDEYGGIFVANFATFDNEEFEVRVKEGGLALHIPSQMTFDLQQPDDEGRWVFAMTDQIAVTFDRDASGEVVGLVVHQSGFSFEVPRKGVELEPEVPVEQLEKFVGTYERRRGASWSS